MTDKNNKMIKPVTLQTAKAKKAPDPAKPSEIGGPKGPEPTRYGDWEKNGKCVDF